MAELKNKYKVFIKELEDTITDKEELKIVKSKFAELFMYFLEEFDKAVDSYDKRMEDIAITQKALMTKTTLLEKSVKEMERDIYDEEDYDFEIVCPYCNNNFIIDLNEDTKNEVICPECNNIIELDWNEENECGGSCDGCNSCDCNHEEDKDASDDSEDDM